MRDFLAGEGVDVRFLAVDPKLMTPPTFCEVWPPDDLPITFYRYPTVPDWQLAPVDFDAAEVAAAPFLLATGTGLAQSPSRETTLAALAAHKGTTIFDLDWRPALWERKDFSELAQAASTHATIVIGNEEEVEAAAGSPAALLELAVPTLVLKRGEHGARLFHEGREVDVPGHPGRGRQRSRRRRRVRVRLRPELCIGRAASSTRRSAAARSRERSSRRILACSEAMPTLQELEAELA